jgi:hypothetical protein
MEEDDDDAFSNDSPTNHQEDEERADLLLSQLGTRSLHDACVYRYRFQWVERLRILLECLRLDMERRSVVEAEKDDGGDVAKFLDFIDSRFVINGKKRGLFHFLLQLALAPLSMLACPPSYSASKLSGGPSKNPDDGIVPLTIRKEAVEALLLLLYDRMEGGVRRFDLYLLLEGTIMARETIHRASSVDALGALDYLEFAMSADDFLRGGGSSNQRLHSRRGVKRYNDRMNLETIQSSVENLRLSLNGLWALLFAEGMGLWRTNTVDWIQDHPLFLDVAPSRSRLTTDTTAANGTPNQGLTGRNLGLTLQDDVTTAALQAQKELELLYRKLIFAGEKLRDRRRVAYKSRRRANADGGMGNDESCDDDELWGVQAPEGVALLSFGLLLQLVRLTKEDNGREDYSSELFQWGEECTRMANDDCAAFAYLECVLDGVVVNPLEGVDHRWSRRLGTKGGEGEAIVRVVAGRMEITMLADDDGMALMNADATTPRDEDDSEFILGLAVDSSSVVYSSIGREILSSTIRVFKQSFLSLQSSSAVENIGMLVDLAAIIYRHSTPLCDQFWLEWNEWIVTGFIVFSLGDSS